jgi:iron complex transport system substrate-binding protein
VGPESSAPQRIVTLAPNSAEIICLLGAGDSIVGVSKFCVYPPELKDRPRVGGLFDPDLERIAALKPDLVVLRGRSDSVEELCRRRGISVYHDRTERLRDVETCILELGKRLGRMEEAKERVERFHDRLDAVRRRVADKPRPRVLLTVSRSPDGLGDVLTTGRGTFLHDMLQTAGGSNVFGHLEMDWPQVSGESIIARQPEVIIELMPEVTLTPALEQQMLDQWKQLGSIPAAVDGRIHFVTDDHCLIPSPRYVEIIEQVSCLLHPEGGGGS